MFRSNTCVLNASVFDREHDHHLGCMELVQCNMRIHTMCERISVSGVGNHSVVSKLMN
jgi:hypothetical protein